MAKLLKLRRGSTSQHGSFTGAEGEVTVDTDKEVLVVHDGSTAGGHPMAAQDMDNVPAGSILGTQLENSGVTAGSYGSSSAIPIVTVDAQGLVTGATTTAIDSTTIANGTSNVAVANNGNITTTRSGTARLVVDDAGADVTGNITATGDIRATGNGSTISVGDNNDLFISHTNNGLIDNNTGDLTIQTQNAMQLKTADAEFGIQLVKHGGVQLYHDNAGPKLETTSSGVSVTGSISATGDLSINSAMPRIQLTDINNNSDFSVYNANGVFRIYDDTNNVSRLDVASDGTTTVSQNLDVGAGIDVTGQIKLGDGSGAGGSDKLSFGAGDDLNIYHNGTDSYIVDTGTGDLLIRGSNDLRLQNADGSESFLHCNNGGDVILYRAGSEKIRTTAQGVSVTGVVEVSGTVDGRDVAADGTKLDGITTGNVGEIPGSASLANGVTAATQSAGNNTTRVATTAFVTTAINNAQAFPSGTKMLFQQTSAPTGWTKQTSGVNNKALRVVSGTVGSGGNVAFTTVFASRGITANAGNTTAGGNVSVANATQGGNVNISSVSTSGNVNSHTLTTSQMPSHSHNYTRPNYQTYAFTGGGGSQRSSSGSGAGTGNTGGGGGHSHGFSGSSHNHNASFSGSAHNHNASFSGSAHNHNISVSNLDMQAEYLDVIIAAKD